MSDSPYDRRSAEFCGRKTRPAREWHDRQDAVYLIESGRQWDPPENAYQDLELRDALLKAGYDVEYKARGVAHILGKGANIAWPFGCHPNDFLTLAASKLQQEKTDAAIDRASDK